MPTLKIAYKRGIQSNVNTANISHEQIKTQNEKPISKKKISKDFSRSISNEIKNHFVDNDIEVLSLEDTEPFEIQERCDETQKQYDESLNDTKDENSSLNLELADNIQEDLDSSMKEEIKQKRQLFYQVMASSIILFCSKCQETREDPVNRNKSFCRKCKAWLSYQCKKCEKLYTKYESIVYHVRTSCNPQESFKCSSCTYTTPIEGHLIKHLKTHRVNCTVCKESFENGSVFDEHKKTCNIVETLSCEHCTFKTPFKRAFRNHILRHVEQIKVRREKRVKNKAVLDLPPPSESNEFSLSLLFYAICQSCEDTKDENNKFKKQCKKCCTKLKLHCLKCTAECESLDDIVCHLKEECGVPEVVVDQCLNCGKILKNYATLKRHYEWCAVAANITCTLCPYKTKYEKCLLRHMHSHTKIDERKIKIRKNVSEKSSGVLMFCKRYCPSCNESVENSPFKNVMWCTKCQSHYIWQCSKCEEKTDKYAKMAYHVKNYCFSSNSPKDCSKCGKKFRNPVTLGKHMTYCGKAAHYQCEQCPFKTKFRQSFKNHSQCHMQKSVSMDESFNDGRANTSLLQLFLRYCSTCNETVENSPFKNEKFCEKCKTEYILQCAKCDKRFPTYRNMVYHARNTCEKTQTMNVCPKCGEAIAKHGRYSRHVKYCGTNFTFNCNDCFYQTNKKENLRSHILTHMNKQMNVDQSEGNTEDDFKSWNKFNRYCPQCNTFTPNNAFKNEKYCEVCKTQYILQCLKCDKQSNNQSSMVYHVTSSCKHYLELKPSLFCDICDFETKVPLALEKHRKSHERGTVMRTRNPNAESPRIHFKRYCEKCDTAFNNSAFKDDKNCKQCKTEMVLMCNNCNKKTKKYSQMVYHIKTYCNMVQIYQCTECDYSTKNSDVLRHHVLFRHTYIDPADYHKCPDCTKPFKTLDLMKKHMKYCSIQPTFSCDQCPFKSKYKKTITRHITAHSSGSNFRKNNPARTRFSVKTKRKRSALQSMKSYVKATCLRCEKQRFLMQGRTKCHLCKSSLQFTCKVCNLESSSLVTLRDHVKEHMNSPVQHCPGCNKSFAINKNFEDHQLICQQSSKNLIDSKIKIKDEPVDEEV
ncbi:zinc finger protein 91-like [Trichogramma pretiosum]|uniref:zinc finger protein 91-like n=1 Tax=Trichogramma pretiosum TaxID=7493 RepID=UPI0006C9C48C|nr:zinc finger protein 91-like [Trichogramma pretiosum]